ncbi:unnamed protein product [Tilletia controversa]|uniref:DUF1746 domain-containing protein n=3 Tax=Tilletia TaxID=13289 RepID=A0A8X7MZ96_9BASI|nr:hypothetical protein CF336_g739 [Tilletia laevis]KAE8205035.1 hypothetical protein CF328_g719 [Tilletia controversa]KAE8262230.1 hypothetical protein A4X03_0g2619 [Tilletia caries]KAE8208448.1 hypothetical protein CF335_g404 [Tilletia laevis]KAE8255295.1 hypothetical protein A4X06_0g492 [Tilletia controversa]
MQSQRRELIRQLDVLLFTLFVYVWFLDKSLLLLALKIGLQVQYCNPTSFNPDLPLPILCRTVLFFNLGSVVSHAFFWTGTGLSPLDDQDGTGIGGAYSRSGRTGFILDFIGQAYQPTKLHLLLLDILTAFLQWLFIIVVSETEKAEELRPDLDEYGLLDGDPTKEIILLQPNEARPHFRRPTVKRQIQSDRRHRSSSDRQRDRRGADDDDEDVSDAGSDAPLRPGETGPSSHHTSSAEALDTSAVTHLSENSELRTRKRKGRLRDLDSETDVVAGSGSDERGGEESPDPHGQGWSPRDEEASLFLPTLGSEPERTRQRRPRGHVVLSERNSLTHPIAHLPLVQLFSSTFTFTPLPANGGSSSASTSAGNADPRPNPQAGSSGLNRSERINPGGGGARAGRMVGSRFGIVPLFRRYHEGEEAVTASGGPAPPRPSRPSRTESGTIPVIALPFSTPTLRVTSAQDTTVTEPERAVGRNEAQDGGTRPPSTPEGENSWAWIMRNFSVPQIRAGQQQGAG